MVAISRKLFLAAALAVATQNAASAQHHHHSYSPGYHLDHHDHVVLDSHGHVIGRSHHDVVHQNPTYIVPQVPHFIPYESQPVTVRRMPYPAQASHIGTTHYDLQPAVAAFGGFSHVDDLASVLESSLNEFLLDLHYNYSHNHGFRETYAEAYRLFEVARYIHEAEHQHDRAAIRSKLNGMDTLFHHVEDDVRGWSRHHHQQVGHLGIISKMERIESALHSLMNDVGVQQAPAPGLIGQSPTAASSSSLPLTAAPPPTLP